MEQWFELNVIFNSMRKTETIDFGFDKLAAFQQNNPSLDINKMLDIYIKLCDL